MELKFECTACGQRISATTELFGTVGLCPQCGSAVEIPNIAVSAIFSHHQAPPKPRNKVGRLVAAICASISVFVGWAVFTSNDATKQTSEGLHGVENMKKNDKGIISDPDEVPYTVADESKGVGRPPPQQRVRPVSELAVKFAKVLEICRTSKMPVRNARDGYLAVVISYREQGNTGMPTPSFISERYADEEIETIMATENRYSYYYLDEQSKLEEAKYNVSSGGALYGASPFSPGGSSNPIMERARLEAEEATAFRAQNEYNLALSRFRAVSANYVTLE